MAAMRWALVAALVLLALVALGFGTPLTRESILEHWERVGRAERGARVSFKLSMKEHNKAELDRVFAEITTPGSPAYGSYRSIAELAAIIAPPAADVARLERHLEAAGMEVKTYGTFVQVSGTIEGVERLFGIAMDEFVHDTHADRRILRSLTSPSIPSEIADVVTFTTGLSNFPVPRRSRRRIDSTTETTNSTYIVPQSLSALYGIPDGYHASAGTSSSQAVVEFGESAGISQTDLETFMGLTDLPTNSTLSYTLGNFEWNPRDPIDGESTLDVQYMMGVAINVPTSFWVIDGWVYDFTTLVQQRSMDGDDVPYVFSMSYGWAASQQCLLTATCDDMDWTNEQYLQATSTGFQMMGASGVTVVVSSGDAGAATRSNEKCNDMETPIQPDYPASDPFVTSVGGTMLENDGYELENGPTFCNQDGVACAGGGEEVVCSVPQALITSGGGFSDTFSQPLWQSDAVSAWMNSGALQPPSQFWNPSGRAYPDVAGMAHAYMVVQNGYIASVDGTSASAPVLGAIFSLINDRRFQSGLGPLGFANPLLYDMAAAGYGSSYNDVTDGTNCGTQVYGVIFKHYCTTFGYGSGPQWDPATGLGTPNRWLDSTSYLLQDHSK